MGTCRTYACLYGCCYNSHSRLHKVWEKWRDFSVSPTLLTFINANKCFSQRLTNSFMIEKVENLIFSELKPLRKTSVFVNLKNIWFLGKTCYGL